jgi:hypothetical protein
MMKDPNPLTKVAQMSSSPVQRITDEADPNRCQAIGAGNQCNMLSMDGSQFCALHGGNVAIQAQAKKDAFRYNAAKWQSRIERHSDDPEIKKLNIEIGVLRLLLEERLNQCKTDIDLMTHSPAISQMVLNIERLVTSCHRLEDKMGHHLDKSAVIQFASQVVEILSEELQDPEALTRIADRIAKAIGGSDDI